MDRKVFTAILLSLVVVGLLLLVFTIFSPFLLPLLWAAVLVTVTHEAYEQLAGWFGGRRTLASLCMTFLVLLLIVGPFLSLALHFHEDVIRAVEKAQSPEMRADIKRVLEKDQVRKILERVNQMTGEPLTADRIGKFAASNLLGPTAEAAKDIIGSVLKLLMNICFILISVFYLYRDGPKAVRACRDLLPMSDADRDLIFGDIRGAIIAAVRGGLLTAVVQGTLGFIILYLLKLDQPVLWASIMALASFIPLVGTAAVWIPIAIYLFLFQDATGKAIILVVYGVLVISMADNFVRPLLVGQHMEAPPLLLFFGILGGITIFGFIGIILGPVVVALMNATTQLFRREFAKMRAEAQAPPPAP